MIVIECQWFSGKIQRCHRWAPGSIPGWRIVIELRKYDTVAEWLRRSTRNRLGLSRAGSSPVSVVLPIVGTPMHHHFIPFFPLANHSSRVTPRHMASACPSFATLYYIYLSSTYHYLQHSCT